MQFTRHLSTRILAIGVAAGLLGPSADSFAAAPATKAAAKEKIASTEHAYKEIDAKELKSWIDSGKKIELIDARPKKFEKGDVIIGAKFLPYDSDATAIAKALPSKDAVIVAYCASLKCPASAYLADQLIKLGYTNVYKYPGGIDDWMDRNFPTGKPKN